jgi:hypothetical protein
VLSALGMRRECAQVTNQANNARTESEIGAEPELHVDLNLDVDLNDEATEGAIRRSRICY